MMERVTVHVACKDRPAELYGLLVSLLNQSFNDWDLTTMLFLTTTNIKS